MIFLYLAIFLSIMHIIGKLFIQCMNLHDYKHPMVYGIILYTGISFIIVLFLSVLHVSWNAFYAVLLLYNITVLCLIGFSFFKLKDKLILKMTKETVLKMVKDNWFIYCMILAFFLLYLTSANGITYRINAESLAGIDDQVYSMIAMKNVGVNHILTNRNGISFDVLSAGSLWNGYWVELLQTDIFTFTRIFLSFTTYVMFFFSIDEVLYLFFKKEYNRVKFVPIVMFLMFLPLGYASEVSKFMLYPWFGNVQTTMILIPVFFIILFHLRYKFSMVYFLIVACAYFFGNSIGAIIYIALMLPILAADWYMVGNSNIRKIKISRKTVLVAVISISLTLLILYAYTIIKKANISIFHLHQNLGEVTNQSEFIYSRAILRNKSLFMTLGLGLYGYRLLKKEASISENIIIGTLSTIFLFSIAPITGGILHNSLQFGLRRFLESVSWVIICYGVIQIYRHISKAVCLKIALINTVIVMILSKTITFYIEAQSYSFSTQNMKYMKKLSPVSENVFHYFNNKSKETHVCLMTKSGLYLTEKTNQTKLVENEYVAYNVLISATKNTFVESCVEANSKVEYLIVPGYAQKKYEQELHLTDQQIEKEFLAQSGSDDVTIIVYRVSNLPAISYLER